MGDVITTPAHAGMSVTLKVRYRWILFSRKKCALWSRKYGIYERFHVEGDWKENM